MQETIKHHNELSGALFCPSAQPGLAGSMIIGVVEAHPKASRVSHLARPVTLSGQNLAALNDDPGATARFRFGAPCQEMACTNWTGSKCRVAQQLVRILPARGQALPRCSLRRVCRWFEQEGAEACMRCSQVVTDDEGFEAALNGASLSISCG